MAEHEEKSYEVSFLGADESTAEAVLTTLKRASADVLLEGPIEKVTLAYPIKKHEGAYFGYVHFRVQPDAITLIDKELKHAEPIIRFLIITPPVEKPKSRWEGKRTKSPGVEEPVLEQRPVEQLPLTNEALEKKIEEILQ